MPPSAPRPPLRCPGEVGPALPWSLLASPQFLLLPAGLSARLEPAEAPEPMPGLCCREQHRPAGGQVSNALQIQVRWPQNAEQDPAGPRAAGSTFMLLPWALLGTLKRGWSRAGTGDEHGQPCRVLAAAAAGGGGLRIPSPGRAAAWHRRPKTRHAKAREWSLCPLLVPTELSPSSPGLWPRPRSSRGCCHPARPPPAPASGVFAIPSSSLRIISHFFPYHHP